MKENLVKDKGWQLLVRLFKTAKEDNEIDYDEQRILRSADLNVTKLLEVVTDAWEDNHLSESEKKEITFLIKKIQDDAVSLAEYDDYITQQEEEMLSVIRDMICDFLNI